MNIHNEIERLITPDSLKFFFCYSDDVQDDILTLKDKLYCLSKDISAFINLELEDWHDPGNIDLHDTIHTNQDIFDKAILQSDYVVFIFYNQFKENTLHEWNLCSNNKKRKPHRFLGLKRTAESINSIDDIKNILKTDNIIFTKYSHVDQFAFAIMRTLLKRCNQRQRDLNKALQDPNCAQFLSADERKRLLDISQNHVEAIKRSQQNMHQILDVNPDGKYFKATKEPMKMAYINRVSSRANMAKSSKTQTLADMPD